MNAPTSLRDLQRALARRITRGDLSDLLDLSARIRSDRGIPAEERLFVYEHAWFARLHEVLREDYGALAGALGDDAFHDLAKLYFMAHPPRSHSLRFAGESLSTFLRSPVAELFAGRWPFAADLAALEWALVDVFDAPDDRLLERPMLATLAPEAWATLRLAPVSAHRLLRLDWPVDRIRAAWTADRPIPAIEPAPTCLLVHRHREQVFYRPVPRLEERALIGLRSGEDFAELCGGVAEKIGEAEAASALVGLVERWIGEGLLAVPEEPTRSH
ncbi:MAG: putative DNA-binding domain-containing protein [Deltaproteobacteria bacterium]|nr:putative DNA-binding domain-containing protein [Deltaproteobacteria bacterium]